MKKIIAMLLALIMVCGLATVAFATGGDPIADESANHGTVSGEPIKDTDPKLEDVLCVPGTFDKVYTIVNGKSPAETFTFNFEAISGTGNDGETITAPALDAVTISFNALDENQTKPVSIPIDVAKFSSLGVYTYKVTEVDNNISGVTYNTNELYMVVTILRDESNGKHYVAAVHLTNAEGTKEADLTNSYDAGTLTVSKQITGNMADRTDTFNFTVTLTDPEGDKINSEILVNNKAWEYEPAATVTITGVLGHGEELKIENIPATVTYTVVETEANQNGYETTDTPSDAEKKISGGDEDTWVFVNDRTKGVDTGVALDSAPYIVMLVVAMAGVVALVSKKRYEV